MCWEESISWLTLFKNSICIIPKNSHSRPFECNLGLIDCPIPDNLDLRYGGEFMADNHMAKIGVGRQTWACPRVGCPISWSQNSRSTCANPLSSRNISQRQGYGPQFGKFEVHPLSLSLHFSIELLPKDIFSLAGQILLNWKLCISLFFKLLVQYSILGL